MIAHTFKSKRGRPLKMSIKARKQAAWNVFSEWIRRNQIFYGPHQLEKCYTCNTILPWKEMQAGHGIGGRNNSILFSEELVRPQCSRCNIFLGGNYKVFTLKLIKELGIKRYEELLIESNKVVKMTPQQFLDIEEEYKKKLENLK